MFLSIEKKEFSEAVHTVARFAQRKNTTLPALSSILIIASDDGIKMRATNLETGIDLTLEGEHKENGVVAVPAALLQQIASSLIPKGTLTLEHTGDILTLTSDKGTSSVKTVLYDDFPSIPLPENKTNQCIISGIVLRNIFNMLASCASPSMVRPELASIYFSFENGILTTVATDSFRLAEKKVPLDTKGIQGTFLIPAKNALDITQALPDDDVTIFFDDHQCMFTTNNRVLVSRLTNAAYPDYRQIIPKDFSSEATILRADFEQGLKQVTVFSDPFQKVRISFNPKKHSLTLFARNTDIGESQETIPAHLTGSALDLSFNHRYLSTALSLTNAESISLSASGIGRPLIIKGIGDTSLLYLISPMNQ